MIYAYVHDIFLLPLSNLTILEKQNETSLFKSSVASLAGVAVSSVRSVPAARARSVLRPPSSVLSTPSIDFDSHSVTQREGRKTQGRRPRGLPFMTSAQRKEGVPSKTDTVSNISKGDCVNLRTRGGRGGPNPNGRHLWKYPRAVSTVAHSHVQLRRTTIEEDKCVCREHWSPQKGFS